MEANCSCTWDRSSCATSSRSSSSAPATTGVQSSPCTSLSAAVNGRTCNSSPARSSSRALPGRRKREKPRFRLRAPGASIRNVHRARPPRDSHRPWDEGVIFTGSASANRRGAPFRGGWATRSSSAENGGSSSLPTGAERFWSPGATTGAPGLASLPPKAIEVSPAPASRCRKMGEGGSKTRKSSAVETKRIIRLPDRTKNRLFIAIIRVPPPS